MLHINSKIAIALSITLGASLSAHAVDDLTVDGYVKSSSGSAVLSGSGECVRTGFKDTQELLEQCGYKTVVDEQVQADNKPIGADVAIVKETTVLKGEEVLAAKEEVVAEKFIENLRFEFDSAELTAGDKELLNRVNTKIEVYRPLLRQNVAYMNVIGHTDSVGSEDYNQKLSERRAQSVADFFHDEGGVSKERLRVSGRGELEPIADNATEEGRSQNRRVVIEVITQK